MPDLGTTNRGHAKRVAKLIAARKSPDSNVFGGIWHWINGVADGIGRIIGGPVSAMGRAILNHLENLVDAYQELLHALWWLQTLVYRLIWGLVRGWIYKLRAQLRAYIRANNAYLIRLIYVTTNQVLMVALSAVRTERRRRVRAVARAEAQAKAEIRALHGVLEREAASGYRIEQSNRVALVIRLLDFTVLRNPALRSVVGDIVSGALDLLSVEDPVARLLLGFLIRHVIDGLGIDKALGHFTDDLLSPLLGDPKPHDLHDVIMDLSRRVLALESQWAQFFTDGGSEVEQAGRDWRDITGPLGTAAVVAFTVQAVTDPVTWARDINDTAGRAASDVVSGAARIFKGA